MAVGCWLLAMTDTTPYGPTTVRSSVVCAGRAYVCSGRWAPAWALRPRLCHLTKAWTTSAGAALMANGVADGDDPHSRWSTSVSTTEHVKRLAAMDRSRVDDTALLFRRGAAGRRCRARAVKGELMDDDIAQLPNCFHELLIDLQSPVSGRTGATVRSSDFANMLDDSGAPRLITVAIMRRKLGGNS